MEFREVVLADLCAGRMLYMRHVWLAIWFLYLLPPRVLMLLTPLVVSGSDGATLLLNSPWADVMASGFLLADMLFCFAFVFASRVFFLRRKLAGNVIMSRSKRCLLSRRHLYGHALPLCSSPARHDET